MGKNLFIAEKPSVAREFANALEIAGQNKNGYLESSDAVVTWCVGHLVTMSYPEKYDPVLKKWRMDTLPFIPEQYKYEVIEAVKAQFQIVSNLLNRPDVDTIYVCTDSGREGEYIYRLVEQMAGVTGKTRKRVWIDSQTKEEICRGIREAKDLSEYDNLSAAAYLRAKEDYLMGINFSRLLTLQFGPVISRYLKKDRTVLSIGRVMTCVLGMVVRREREIRSFVKTSFYKVNGTFLLPSGSFQGEWRVNPASIYYQSPSLYKDNGFKKRDDAEKMIQKLMDRDPREAVVQTIERKMEKKNPPLLYNLAEIQNDCSKRFKISPDQTLTVIQSLYEKKMVTYPRTDARVLSSAVAKEIDKNISGLLKFQPVAEFADEILKNGAYKNIGNSRYTNDKQITDHYAIIPTGQAIQNYYRLSKLEQGVYEMICRRFLSIFYPAAEYRKYSLVMEIALDAEKAERFAANFKALEKPGYFKVTGIPAPAKKDTGKEDSGKEEEEDIRNNPELLDQLNHLKKGSILPYKDMTVKEGETSPPSRYNSGSMILAMENAGQLIEDEELRAHIKSCGIGTSATRAEILKKLVKIEYLNLNTKTQIITPTFLGELVYEVVFAAMPKMLDAEMTASWEKGLNYVAQGQITQDEYMGKLKNFIINRTSNVKMITRPDLIVERFYPIGEYYKKK